jgi:copper chaperone CopZ
MRPSIGILAALILGFAVCGCARRTEPASSASPVAMEARSTAHGDRPVDPSATPAPRIVTIEIGGMTCQGCVTRIQKQLEVVPGVHRVDVSLDQQRAQVLADSSVRDTALTGAVRRAGSEFLGMIHR